MKTFIPILLFFGIAIFVIKTSDEYDGIRHNFHDAGLRQAAVLEKKSNEVRTIVLGDSMSGMAIDPDDPTVFNFASPGDNVLDMLDKFRFAQNILPGLETVVVQYTAHMFSIERKEVGANRFDWLSNPEYHGSAICYRYGCCANGAGKLTCAANHVREVVQDVLRDSGTAEIAENGWVKFSMRKQWRVDASPETDQENLEIYASPPVVKLTEAYTALIGEIRSKNFNLIYYEPPIYAPRLDRAKELLGIYPNDLPVLRNLIAGIKNKCHSSHVQNDRAAFFNSTHVSALGASLIRQPFQECIRSASF